MNSSTLNGLRDGKGRKLIAAFGLYFPLLSALLWPKYAHGTTPLYVSYGSGSDANAGTSTSQAIQHFVFDTRYTGAIKQTNGDTIILKLGDVYTLTNYLTLTNASLTITTNGSWGTGTNSAIDGGGTSPGLLNVDTYHNGASNLTLVGIELRNVACQVASDSLLYVYDGINIIGSNCCFHNWTVSNTVTSDSAHGGPYFNNANGTTNCGFFNCSLSNAEHPNNGTLIRGANFVIGCTLMSNSSFVLFSTTNIGNTIAWNNGSSFDVTYHVNGWYGLGINGFETQVFASNSISYISGGSSVIYPSGNTPRQIYDNRIFGTLTGQYAIEDASALPNFGTLSNMFVANNTLYDTNGTSLPRMLIHFPSPGSGNSLGSITAENNLLIGTNIELTDYNGSGAVVTNANLIVTPTVATGYGIVPPTLTPTSAILQSGQAQSLYSLDALGQSFASAVVPWPPGAVAVLAASSSKVNITAAASASVAFTVSNGASLRLISQ